MITKWYEVTCDWCGNAINHYIDKKPTDKMLRDDGCVVKGGNVFCAQQCCDYYYNLKRFANEQENTLNAVHTRTEHLPNRERIGSGCGC